MPNIILAINAGSSSVKVSVYAYEDSTSTPQELAVIQISGLTAPPASLKYDRGDEHIKDQELPDISGQEPAYEYILNHLIADPNLPELPSVEAITFACHRIVHGGDFSRPERIDRSTYHKLEELSDLAPLHNVSALTIVQAVHARCPNTTNVAFFDSAFHATLPLPVRTYAISPSIASKNKLRKYGFHGLSYAYITRRVAVYLGKPASSTNIIALHLGSGASACCISHGVSVDTTMGLTPLSGLPGATRSGDVDASLIFHFTHSAGKLSAGSSGGMHITQAEAILNKESGWAAMTGTTDFGAVSAGAERGEEGCVLAYEVFLDRVVGYVGAYSVKLGGEVDALVFAGGIGEKGGKLRRDLVGRVKCLGFEIDGGRNESPGGEGVVDIGAKESKHRVLICQTDEQAEMARQCVLEAGRLQGKGGE